MFSRKGNSKSFFLRFNFTLTLLFLLYFVSSNKIYAQYEIKDEPKYLIPVGQVIQMDTRYDRVIVGNNPNCYPFEKGDFIIAVNDIKVDNIDHFSTIIKGYDDDTLTINILRNNKECVIKTSSQNLHNVGFCQAGVGIATLTYINPENNKFGGMAHSFIHGFKHDLPIQKGVISIVNDIHIKKSIKGEVGYLEGVSSNVIGKFDICTPFGINGVLFNYNTNDYKKYKVADLDEVKLGKASIILQINGEYNKFDIEILDIKNQTTPDSKSFEIEIVDKKLLDLTGGIVQGMSGSPIVQGDKIIGAVSHVDPNNPSQGNALFIKWMLNN